jgi:DNA-binding protein YbaB
MFEKLKQLKELKQLQDSLAQQKVESEKSGTKIVMNGKMEVEEITLNPALSKEQQEKAVKDCFNDAVRKIQLHLAQTMSKMPGFKM